MLKTQISINTIDEERININIISTIDTA